MAEYISKQAAVDAGYLSDWYISSVGDELPVWTDAHIDELLNDFIVIPKDTKPADVQPVKRGKWVRVTDDDYECSECKAAVWSRNANPIDNYHYCWRCGADMRGEDNEESN